MVSLRVAAFLGPEIMDWACLLCARPPALADARVLDDASEPFWPRGSMALEAPLPFGTCRDRGRRRARPEVSVRICGFLQDSASANA